MRVLHVVPYYWPATEWGGPTRSVPELVSALRASGIDANVFTTNSRGRRGLPRVTVGTQLVNGVPVTYFRAVGGRRFFFSPKLAVALSEAIPNVDLVHVHGLWTWPNLTAARLCELHKVPYIVSPRGSLDPWALAYKSAKKRIYLWVAEDRTLQRAALLHFTANNERDAAPPKYRARPNVVIPNCLDATPFSLLDQRKRHTSHELVIVGRVHPEKGFDLLLPALKLVRDAVPGVRLSIVGPDEGGYLNHVLRQADELGIGEAVDIKGALDADARNRVLESAAVLIAPSYRENFGMAVAEAMAAGLAVVVSDRVNIAPAISEAGAGIVVSPTVQSIACALVRLLARPAERVEMGNRGRSLVRDRFSRQVVGSRMRQAYETLLG